MVRGNSMYLHFGSFQAELNAEVARVQLVGFKSRIISNLKALLW